MRTIRPDNIEILCAAVADARASGERLMLVGGGSKSEIGSPCFTTRLDLRGFTGIVDHDPAELVLTARAGTPLGEIEAVLERHGQMLAFEPWDHAPLFGQPAGRATIGGVIAAGVAGPRRLSAGASRDHLLGFTAVSGKGERFVAGGKVVKNVTGFDLSKLLTGSWGRLAALVEVSLKVLPRPRVTLTLASAGLSPALARALMLGALSGPGGIAAAAYLPAASEHAARERSLALLRLEGFGPSVEARAAALIAESSNALVVLPPEEADLLWREVRTPTGIDSTTLWRVHLPATAGASFLEELAELGAQCVLDWGGSLLWIGWNGDPHLIRPAVEGMGGHAQLVRAPADLRRRIPAHHPRGAGLAALEARVRRAFDPDGVFETGRFGEPG